MCLEFSRPVATSDTKCHFANHTVVIPLSLVASHLVDLMWCQGIQTRNVLCHNDKLSPTWNKRQNKLFYPPYFYLYVSSEGQNDHKMHTAYIHVFP